MKKTFLRFLTLCIGIVMMSLLPTLAGASYPRAIPHGSAPFGTYYKAVCAPPKPGYAACQALVLTNARGAVVPTTLPSGYGPADLQEAYGLKYLSAHKGVGETVAIVDAGGDTHAVKDLAKYRSTYKLPKAWIKVVNQNGGSSLPPSQGWEDEISLDLDMVSAIAPHAHIVLVESNSASFADLATAENQAVKQHATQISNSWSGDEFYASSYNSDFNHKGVEINASAGDYGYFGDGVDAGFPASSQYVTAVGGTSLTKVSPRTETAWGPQLDTWDPGQLGTGSGCSTVFSKPSWQHDTGCKKKMVNDVAADADPATGVAIYDTNAGGWAVYGGTSASSPMIASVEALMKASSPHWPYQHLSYWHDIKTGNNITTNGGCVVAYFCHGKTGYDGPTGLGTPNGSKM